MARRRPAAQDSGPYTEADREVIRESMRRIRKQRDICTRYDRIGVNCTDLREQLDDLERGFLQVQQEFFPNDALVR